MIVVVVQLQVLMYSVPAPYAVLIATPNLSCRLDGVCGCLLVHSQGVLYLAPSCDISACPTGYPPSFQLVQVFKSCEYHLFRRLLDFAGKEHLV